MKKQLLLTFFLLTNLICNSQNILFLKNGDRLNGKLEGLKLDTLIFKLQGTKIKIASSDIIAIYMDAKIAPSSLLNNTNIVKQESGKISGVLTYYFNQNFGDKPDVGASIFVADSAMIPEFNFDEVLSFQSAIMYRKLLDLYNQQNRPLPALIQSQADKNKWAEKTVFDELDKISSRNITKFKNSDKAIKALADGAGNYSIKVDPGTYYILIESNNRNGMTITEISGKIYLKKVLIKAGDEQNVSQSFGL